MSKIKITLIDTGQDFLSFICDQAGKIIEVHPQPALPSIWIGSYIPVNDPELIRVGKQCSIRKSHSTSYGYLRHIIKKIETL